ncbi:4-alpha-glucanotransferase [Propionibacterium australiense]|uniref:4-alpha-glucanotransferase n=1 Tax=Propionibacterium australiense TaxID=119981 RepID=A0A8B3FPP9_9ACTN|nr:4-alpha-glucanotransferase [Propionibacterium australiense]RLP07923.1 4-alpha-glucanotransferase [Propionibacterium australiense]
MAHAGGHSGQGVDTESIGSCRRRDDLLKRLKPLGVADSYLSAHGTVVEVPTATLELVNDHFREGLPPGIGEPLVCTPGRYHPELFGDLVLEDGYHYRAHGVVDVPGYHVLHTATGQRRFVIAAPERLRTPERCWGWQIQLYSARSRDSWGIGDFRDLGRICRIAHSQHAYCVQVSPVHAIAPVSNPQDSPYSPASRQFLNLLHIAPGHAPGAERVDLSDLSEAGRALNGERLIDRPAVWALKKEALLRIWQVARTEEDIEYVDFCRHRGRALRMFAIWCAIADELDNSNWREWPGELHRPDSPAVLRWAEEHADKVAFYSWCQWIAEAQYAEACTCGVDVVADLAVGFDQGSEDAWVFQDSLCFDFEIGCPPDTYNIEGQRWGLPPFNPQELIRNDFGPFIEMVQEGLRHAKALRIDHVMQLWRLYWVPKDGTAADGVYVDYPVHALLAILRLEAMRAGAWIVGEDMGTVPPGVRESMADIGMLANRSAMRVDTDDFPELGVGTSSTHDQVTIAGLVTGADVEALRRIGKNADWAQIEHTRRSLAADAGIDPDKPCHQVDGQDVHDAILARYRRLSSAPSRVVLAVLDDAAMVRERPNMPGTVGVYPNWCLALPEPVGHTMLSPMTRDLVQLLSENR